MTYAAKLFGHLKNIIVHKYNVFVFCCRFGIIWRGIWHDMSKLNPIEFFESVKYYQGDKSPIPVAKQRQGYSKAWQHHKGRNTHHYEYWTDDYDIAVGDGLRISHRIAMPYNDMLEMLADWCAAAKTYNKGKFSYVDEYNWARSKFENNIIAMHPVTHKWVLYLLDELADGELWKKELWTKKNYFEKYLRTRRKRLKKRYMNDVDSVGIKV